MRINLLGSTLTLLPEKALYKEDEQLLIIADVHLGKAGHFRKSGFNLPQKAQMADYEKLRLLFAQLSPASVYFLGDLFHSELNGDWKHFSQLVLEFPAIKFALIKGNHDLVDEQLFEEIGVTVVDELRTEQGFVYSHMPVDCNENEINLVGHIHPGIELAGKGKQRVRLPCFHLCGNTLFLPAFGRLTGLYIIECGNEDRVFGVLPSEVIEL